MVCLLSVWERVHGCDIYYSLSQGSSQGLFTVKARQRRAYFQTALCVRRAATSNQCHSNMPLVSVHQFYVCVFLNSFSWKDVLQISSMYETRSPRHTNTPLTTTQSYLMSWHLDVVSLEALRMSCPRRFMTLEQLMPFFWRKITLLLQLPLGQRWTQRSHCCFQSYIPRPTARSWEILLNITFLKNGQCMSWDHSISGPKRGLSSADISSFFNSSARGELLDLWLRGGLCCQWCPCAQRFMSVWSEGMIGGMGLRDQRSDLVIFTFFFSGYLPM